MAMRVTFSVPHNICIDVDSDSVEQAYEALSALLDRFNDIPIFESSDGSMRAWLNPDESIEIENIETL